MLAGQRNSRVCKGKNTMAWQVTVANGRFWPAADFLPRMSWIPARFLGSN